MKTKGFTLIELLVVISIIGVIASIVLVSFSGSRDKAKIARSQQFSANINHSLGAYAAGIWDFEDQNDPTIDRSGFGNDGTLHGDTHFVANDALGGHALSFDGSGDYVEIASKGILNPGSNNFTVEVWFKLNSTGSLYNSILYNKENLYEASAGGGYFTYAWQPHWNWDGGNSFSVSMGQWYHAVVVYDHTNQYVYKNGKLVYSRAQTGDMGTNTNALRIGARGAPGGASSFFPGVIDNIRMYDHALSASQIQQHYALGAEKHGIALDK